MTPLDKAKAAILGDIKKTLPGTGDVVISVEAHGGVEFFRQSLESLEVQQALAEKQLTARLEILDPLADVKNYIIYAVIRAKKGQELIFQTLSENADLYYSALALPEIKSEIIRKNVKASIQVLGKPQLPQILITTIDDVASGKLDEYL